MKGTAWRIYPFLKSRKSDSFGYKDTIFVSAMYKRQNVKNDNREE